MTHRPARLALWAALGFALVQFAWILVLPPFTGIDEVDHTYRASSVASGHWEKGGRVATPDLARGPLVPVRADVAEAAAPACDRLPYVGPWNCRPARDLPGEQVEIATGAAAYNPVFYAVVGTIAKPFHGNAYNLALRVASGAICAFLFWIACRAALLGTRTRWPLIGVIAAALPTTIYSTIVAAPNGAEMMAGLAFWSVALALVRSDEDRRWLYPAAMLGVVLLTNMHTLGSIWLALIVATLVVQSGVRRVLAGAVPKGPMEWLGLLIAAAFVVFEILWVLDARTNDPGSGTQGLTDSVWPKIPTEAVLWVFQAIAVFPFRNEPAPTTVYGVALLVLLVFTVKSLRRATGPRDRATLGFVVAISFGVPIVLTVITYSGFDLTWQGRYGMPFTAGFLILLGLILDRSGTADVGKIWTLVGVLAWAFVQVGGMVEVRGDFLGRNKYLTDSIGWSEPPIWILIGLGGLAAACWHRSLRTTPAEATS